MGPVAEDAEALELGGLDGGVFLGVGVAALADLDLPVELLRGFSLLARTAGLLGQIAEERRRPMAMDVYMSVDRAATYVEPDVPPSNA